MSRAPGVKPPSPGAQRLARWKAKGRPVSVTLQGADAIRAWDALTGGEGGESQRELVEAALILLARVRTEGSLIAAAPDLLAAVAAQDTDPPAAALLG